MDSVGVSVDAALVLIARLCFGLFFLPSALGKLLDIDSFIQGTLDYRVLPEYAARLFGLALPWCELLVSVALLLGIALPIAGGITALLLLCFTIAVFINLRRGRVIACNCLGITGSRMISWGTVARNSVLLLLTIPVIVLAPMIASLEGWLGLWRTNLQLIFSRDVIVVALLIAFCFVTLQLIEWGIDVTTRIARLKRVHG